MKVLSRVRLFAIPWTVAYQGSSTHGIFQARVLKWVAISFSGESSRPRDRTQLSHIAGRCFTVWATREAHSWSNLSAQILACKIVFGGRIWHHLKRVESFLVVHWLRLCTSNPGSTGLIPGWETKIPHAVWCDQRKKKGKKKKGEREMKNMVLAQGCIYWSKE